MKHLAVGVGDVVIANFDSICGGPERKVKVTGVEKRYGRTNGTGNYMRPLVNGHNTETGKLEHFDVSFVKKIIERAPAPVPELKNIYRDCRRAIKNSGPDNIDVRRSTCRGGLCAIAVYFLAKLPFLIDRPIHEERLRYLWQKQSPGLVSEEFFIITVRKKAFGRWIRQNWTRILTTSAELHAAGTEHNLQAAQMMDAYLERMMAEDHDFYSGSNDPYERMPSEMY